MTKHLIALVRLAGQSIRILITLTQFFERFPLDRLIIAIELFIQWAEHQGLSTDTDNQPTPDDAHLPPAEPTDCKNQYTEDELMTIKEAMDFIPVSRSKLFVWRMERKLQTIERNCRSKRLVRTEVEALRIWARNKGKW